MLKGRQDDFEDVIDQVPGFENPFETMLKSNQGLDKEKVFELLEPKFEEVIARILEAKRELKFAITESSVILDKKMDKN